MFAYLRKHLGQIYFVTICFETRTTRTGKFTPEWTLLCVPSFLADPATDGTRQSNFAILDFTRKIALIGGTGYTGEMKRNFLCIEFHITCEQRYLCTVVLM
jgi:ATP-dependent phosphoenolpyruvate carboxykinase